MQNGRREKNLPQLRRNEFKLMHLNRKQLIAVSFILIINICLLTGAPALAGIEYTGYGANKTVSGSLHLLNINGEKLILDTGSFFAVDGSLKPEQPDDICKDVMAVFLSHAHSDHTGRLLELVKMGYDGPIYCSEPTAAILPVMLEMAARYGDFGRETFYYTRRNYNYEKVVHRYDCKWGKRIKDSNKRFIHISRDKLEPMGFSLCEKCMELEVKQVMDKVKTIPLNQKFKVTSSLKAEFFNTPHIPGSVCIKITEIDDVGNAGQTVIYSGDLGSGVSPFLKDQQYINKGDYLLVEGTYGTDVFVHQGDERRKFRQFLGLMVREDKRVIIPAFVLDRTQQVLYEIKRGIEDGEIPEDVTVKLFSPTAYEINRIYQNMLSSREYAGCFKEDLPAGLKFNDILTWADYGNLELSEGEIIICSPGMADSGFSLDFVKNYLEDEDTVFVFVGYQSPGTVGGRLTSLGEELAEILVAQLVAEGRGDSQVESELPGTPSRKYSELDGETSSAKSHSSPTGYLKLDGEKYRVKADVKQFFCFSSHADFRQIQKFIASIKGLKKVLLVHTEDYWELKKEYEKLFPEIEFIVPGPGQKIFLSPVSQLKKD